MSNAAEISYVFLKEYIYGGVRFSSGDVIDAETLYEIVLRTSINSLVSRGIIRRYP